MTKYTAHEKLLREALGAELQKLSEDQALAWMILFHTHEIRLKPGVHLEDVDARLEPIVLHADTQRGVAETIAAVWPDRSGADRTSYAWWYWTYNTKTPFELPDDVPQEWRERVERVRNTLRGHPFVSEVAPED